MSNECHNSQQDREAERSSLEQRLLILRAMKGEHEAFESLFRMYHPRLLYYVRRLVKSTDRADDVMQEAWMQIYKSLPRLRAPEAFLVWCYRICRNVAAQDLRHLKQEALPVDYPSDIALNQDNNFLKLANAELVHKALERLSPLHQEVLILRYLEDMSYEQIAEVTVYSINTVKSRLHYAKAAMLEAVGGLKNE